MASSPPPISSFSSPTLENYRTNSLRNTSFIGFGLDFVPAVALKLIPGTPMHALQIPYDLTQERACSGGLHACPGPRAHPLGLHNDLRLPISSSALAPPNPNRPVLLDFGRASVPVNVPAKRGGGSPVQITAGKARPVALNQRIGFFGVNDQIEWMRSRQYQRIPGTDSGVEAKRRIAVAVEGWSADEGDLNLA